MRPAAPDPDPFCAVVFDVALVAVACDIDRSMDGGGSSDKLMLMWLTEGNSDGDGWLPTRLLALDDVEALRVC